ncbi:MAG: RNA polymerase sigma factor [Saprospiraceae bacterium]|nr:RNA polymerase sigma factor [Saprospiraceae bacterium]
MEQKTDQLLIKGCINNDRKSQESLYTKYFKKMFLMCSRYSHDESLIGEIVNDSFLSVFKNIHKYEGRGSLEGWIRRITFNTLADHFRKKNREIKFLLIDENEYMHLSDFQTNSDTHDYDDIISKVNTLKGSFKDVFVKYAIEGYNHKEIGEALHISEGTSKWYLSEARKKLQLLFNTKQKSFRYGR